MPPEAAPPPLDALLARREWVRRFARTLAKDDASADDLAQDAWVAAVERPPRPDAPAGWFRRVLTRRAIDVSRGDARRGRREGGAARPEATASTADVVAAAESHRRVVEAVMALDEPYRATVLLRFFEDLPPREVAARMGVPVETVRARVRRAVEKLRERLDEEHGGERAAWLAPLLAETTGPRGPSPLTTAGRGAAMTTTQKTVAAAALVALLFGGAWIAAWSVARPRGDAKAASDVRADEATERRARRRRRGQDVAEDDAPPAVAVPAPPSTAAASDPPAADEDAPPDRFDVFVVDPSHAPVDGVRVRITVADMGFQPADQQALSAVTDARGHAGIKVGSEVKSASLDAVGPDGRVWRMLRGQTWLRQGRAEYLVERGAWIAGRVVVEDGAPLPAATVAALDHGRRVATSTTDADGRFRLLVPAEGSWDVVLDPGGSMSRARAVARDKSRDAETPAAERPWEFGGEVRGIGPGAQDVVITAACATKDRVLHVRTVSADGRPIAGVALAVQTVASRPGPVGSAPRPKSGPDGCVAVEGVPDRRVQVIVGRDTPDAASWELDGWVTPTDSLLAPPGDEELTFVFEAGRAIRGRIETPQDFEPRADPAGLPMRAMVSLLDGPSTRQWWSRADVERRFVVLVPATATGPFRVAASLPGKTRDLQTVIEDVRPDAGEVVVRFPAK